MNVSTGKFGDADPEIAKITATVTPQLEFDKLAMQVNRLGLDRLYMILTGSS